jgi:ribonuclease P protein component
MGKYVTVKENRDFSRIYHKGRSFVSPVLVTYVIKNRSGNIRYGITTGKKIGNAVKRSRARRVIRASYYQLYSEIKPGHDIIFVARGKTPFVKSQTVMQAMKKHLESAGVLKGT